MMQYPIFVNMFCISRKFLFMNIKTIPFSYLHIQTKMLHHFYNNRRKLFKSNLVPGACLLYKSEVDVSFIVVNSPAATYPANNGYLVLAYKRIINLGVRILMLSNNH